MNKKSNKKSAKPQKLSIKKRLNKIHPLKMFSKKELMDHFTESHKYYSKCMLKDFELNNLYQNNYQNVYSNKQIKTLWNLSKNDLNIRHRLLSIITKRINPNSYNVVLNILNKYDKDEDIYNKLHKIYLNNDKNRKRKEICPLLEFKSSLFYEKIMNFVIKNNNKIIIDNYLDIGCGNCKVTEKIGKLLGLDNENIHGVDFLEFDEQKYSKEKNINFKLLEHNYKSLPYEDNSISVITLINVLHHVDNLNILLKEIKRILKKDGILMIIEPDVFDYVDYMLLDIEHLLYHFVYNKNRDENLKIKDIKDISNNYYNWISLDIILKEYGLKYKYSNFLSRKFKYEISSNREFFSFYML
jgi:ubiquinone/menaquinone biosynthesis C-methylase UbiE